MTESKDNESFFRKVVRFVANPATDWAELNSRQDLGREEEFEKSELKAMIERKRRNDFVRKREFDMLRKVRREGLSPEQLAALGSSSPLDDSELRSSDQARPDGVKAKIDEIEQQMVGSGFAPTGTHRTTGFSEAPTRPQSFPATARSAQRPAVMGQASVRQALDTDHLPPLPPLPDLPDMDAAAAGQTRSAGGPTSLAPLSFPEVAGSTGFSHPFTVEVNEMVHDPELDDAVISFANADFAECEQAITDLTADAGARSQHAETWLVLFDLFRATGQQAKFEALALTYANQFGWSAPQWYSLPKLAADAVAAERPQVRRQAGAVGWTCPAQLDAAAVARLCTQTQHMPLPWVFDWSGLAQIDVEAATALTELFRQWAAEPLDMRWLGGDVLLAVLQRAAPSGARDADPAFWIARMTALRLANRPDQFDEAAIDYCVTFEVSPPSWERSSCKVRIAVTGQSTQASAMSMPGEGPSGFAESSLTEDLATGVKMATVELSGQLVGDISATLTAMDQELGAATVITVSCERLIRVDFIAAGDLLNWVLSKRSENRSVCFADAHRLVALFFGAMGINEHARVRVRTL